MRRVVAIKTAAVATSFLLPRRHRTRVQWALGLWGAGAATFNIIVTF